MDILLGHFGRIAARLAQAGRTRRLAAVVCLVAIAYLGRSERAEAALTCTPSGQTVNFGSYNAGPSTTTSQRSSCTGGVANDTVIQCTMFVSNSKGSAGTTGPFYMKNGTSPLNFTIRQYGGSDITTGVWYTQTATVNSSGNANLSELFTALPLSGQSGPAGNYSSDFTVRVKVGSSSTVHSDCSGAGVVDSNVDWAISTYIDSGCSVSGNTMDFGNTDALTANVDATVTIVTNCTSNLSYTVSLDGGKNGGTNVTNRHLANGSNTITYGLYTNAARTNGWYGASVNMTGTGSNQSVSVYGRVPPQTTPPAATYTDTVVITLTY